MHKLKALLSDAVLFDMTNLLNYPIRTGIQRVTHQLSLHWPNDRPILPFRHAGPDKICILPPEILIHAERYFSSGDDLIQRAALEHTGSTRLHSEGFHRMMALSRRPLLEVDSVTAARQARALLSLELSLNTGFYGRLASEVPEKVYVLNYDYILWLNPEFNSEVDWTSHDELSEYLSVLRKFPHQSFISSLTRNNYYRFIDKACARTHPIIIPGTDGLGVTRRDHTGDGAKFVTIGTVEPRKQHLKIMRAIERAQAQGVDVSLTIIGKMGWLKPDDRRSFDRIIEGNPRIDWLDAPADDQLIDQLSRARASIFFSRTEGFGGPPVESLSLGVPIIVSDTTPSVLDLPNRGQIRVDPNDETGLCAAIRFFADPAKARSKQDEIAELDLPTWRSFIVGLSDWLDETAPMRGRPVTMRGRIDELSLGKLIEASPSIAHFLPSLFRTAMLREPSPNEIAGWLDHAEAEGLDKHGVVARFLEEAARQRPEALSLLSSALGSGGAPEPQVPAGIAAEAMVEEAERIILLQDNRRVAECLYSDIHRRSASPEELDNMTAALDAGYPRSECLVAALGSDEFQARNPGIVLDDAMRVRILAKAPYELIALLNNGGDQAFVEATYGRLLRRQPDLEGRTTYLRRLKDGESREDVLLDILLSTEAEQKGLDIDVVNGLILSIAHPHAGASSPLASIAEAPGSLADMVASQLVTLYRLKPQQFDTAAKTMSSGRRSDQTGVEFEAGSPAADRQKRLMSIAARLPLTVLGGIDVAGRLGAWVRTTEAKRLLDEPNEAVFVDGAYKIALGRSADPEGRAHYLDLLERGMTRLAVLLNVLQSDEAVERNGREDARWIAARLAGHSHAASPPLELAS